MKEAQAQGIQSPPEVVRLFRCKNASFGDVFDVDAPHPNEIISVQVSDSDNRGGGGGPTSCSYPETHHPTVDYDEETGIVVGRYYSMDGPITSSSSLSKNNVNKKEGVVSSSLSSPCDTCKHIVPFPFVFIFLCVLFLLGIGEMLREVSARSQKSHDE